MPIAYIPRTRELYSAYAPYRWVVNDAGLIPWTGLVKPVSACKIAMITSAGILYRDQPRFHREDTSYRRIPKNAGRNELSVWHFGYPTTDAKADPNCVFPLGRMREFEAEGFIGELSDPAFSFMGGIYSARKVREELTPKIIDELRSAHVDLFYLVPG